MIHLRARNRATKHLIKNIAFIGKGITTIGYFIGTVLKLSRSYTELIERNKGMYESIEVEIR